MPYLQVDLDALEEFEVAGALVGTGPAHIAFGCLKLWRDCWRQKTEYVGKERLMAFFPGADEKKLTTAMTACGFLEAPPSRPDFRVKGAERRLGIRKKQQEAGKRHVGNLRQYREGEPEDSPGLPGTHPEVEPEPTRAPTSGSTPALTASIQQPTSNSSSLKKNSGAPQPEGLVYEPPTKPEDEWDGEDFFRWAQSRRIASGLVGEKWPKHEKLRDFWRAVLLAKVSVGRLKEAFYRYGQNPWWERPGVSPPHPWNGFQSEWSKYVPQEEVRRVGA